MAKAFVIGYTVGYMIPDVIKLTQDLVAIPSVSIDSNVAVSDYLQRLLLALDFEVERLSYDDNGQEKVSLVARKGSGSGGLGFFSHSDTVPGDQGWNPYDPVIANGKLYGRGSCDMKGPLAATIVAAAKADVKSLKRPIYIGVASDEENGYHGAMQICRESKLLAQNWPTHGVIAEPTEMRPVYSHKGGTSITVTAIGFAAHTSTEKGTSANFLIAPFLAEMAELVPYFKTEARFLNHEFNPPSFGFNMTLNDFGTRGNVSAGKTVCGLSIRNMPKVDNEGAIALISEKAQKYGLKVDVHMSDYFYVSPQNSMVQAACRATELAQPETVAYGTEAVIYQKHIANQVVLGPGNIAQAHTVGEWITLDQLTGSVGTYERLIAELCGA